MQRMVELPIGVPVNLHAHHAGQRTQGTRYASPKQSRGGVVSKAFAVVLEHTVIGERSKNAMEWGWLHSKGLRKSLCRLGFVA